jgi:hypothetical protein
MMLKNAMNGGLLCDNLVRDLLTGLLFREGDFCGYSDLLFLGTVYDNMNKARL